MDCRRCAPGVLLRDVVEQELILEVEELQKNQKDALGADGGAEQM